MDVDTVEACWVVLQQYIKKSDREHAIAHLVNEIVDTGIVDEEFKRLGAIDELFENALLEHNDSDIANDFWSDDDWEQ